MGLNCRFPLPPRSYLSSSRFSATFLMPIMYCNYAKKQAFPLFSRVSGCPLCFTSPKNIQNHCLLTVCNQKTLESIRGIIPKISSSKVCHKEVENNNRAKPRNISAAFCLKTLEYINIGGTRKFSDGFHQKATENKGEVKPRKTLPWIAAYKNRSERVQTSRTNTSSWEESAKSYFQNNDSTPSRDGRKSRNRKLDSSQNGRNDSMTVKHDAENEENDEPVDDPRWNRIKTKYRRIIDRESRRERPEVHRWNKQEKWGRKTWKEATESTVPKMVGEGIYGVGPVLAALTVGRREFYTLYIQEGMDLSENNRKKKDKRGVEKVLKMAEKIGLTVKQASKHDLNMVVDNRPQQGLVLDASPLEMVSIRELDPATVEEDTAPLWIALDEVMDPQNLGAIVRSAYFFGAAGVVLCAKNSAPLSGVVSKASAGSLELIELRSCKNMMQFLTSSVENGWRVLGGSVSSRAVSLNAVAAGVPTILVLGSEGTGLRPLVERSCTQLIKIPGNMPGNLLAEGVEGEESVCTDLVSSGKEYQSFLAVESLNVSVAAGVLLYHLVGSSNRLSRDKKMEALD